MKLIQFDQQFNEEIIGVDEAGRGPLAGPVVVAAVILNYEKLPLEVNDSKKLSKSLREKLFTEIINHSIYNIFIVDPLIIDKVNILEATKIGMYEAIKPLIKYSGSVLIDGNQLPQTFENIKYYPIIKGDNLSASIAAASILAKVTRDRIMVELSQDYPNYGWDKNAGYGTKAHLEAIEKFGITEHHRKSFGPVKRRLFYAS